MKTRILSLMCSISVLIMLSSCTKDNVQQSEPVSSTFDFTLEATLADLNPSGEDTKASATSVVRLSWKAGDRISVINLTTGKALGGSLTADATGTTTTFSGTLSGAVGSGDKLVFLYPSQGYTEEQDYQPVTIDLSSQAGSVKDGVPICVYATTSASSNVFNKASAKFNFLMSYIQFSFTGLEPGAAIKSVEVEDIGSTMTLSLTSDGIAAAPSTGTITLTPENYKVSTSGSKAFYMSFAQSPKVSSRKITVMTDNEFKQGLFSGSALAVNNSYSAIVANFTDKPIPIADPVFKAYCVENFDTDGNGEITLDEARAVTSISISTKFISTLEGIEYFTNLKTLDCYGGWDDNGSRATGELTSLDVSKNINLMWLYCKNNHISNLDYNENLQALVCDNNQLTSLDVSNNTMLTHLYCDNNQLTSLDVSNNTVLTHLSCSNNQLTNLDVSNNNALISLNCGSNELYSLDVSNNTSLTSLYCGLGNQLTGLDISTNTALLHLDCSFNQISALDLSKNTALTFLDCEGNQLSSLDISNNIVLENLDCSQNKITSLDVSVINTLKLLHCYYNQIASLNVSNNPALTVLRCNNNELTSLDVSSNIKLENLNCAFNALTSLDVSNNTALTELRCPCNQIVSLDVSNNTALSFLYCISMPSLLKVVMQDGQNISELYLPESTVIERVGNSDMGDGGDLED